MLRVSGVASSREDAWIETCSPLNFCQLSQVASSREDAWIETTTRIALIKLLKSRPPARTRGLKPDQVISTMPQSSRVLPRGRVD